MGVVLRGSNTACLNYRGQNLGIAHDPVGEQGHNLHITLCTVLCPIWKQQFPSSNHKQGVLTVEKGNLKLKGEVVLQFLQLYR